MKRILAIAALLTLAWSAASFSVTRTWNELTEGKAKADTLNAAADTLAWKTRTLFISGHD